MDIRAYRTSKGKTTREVVQAMQLHFPKYSGPVNTAVENPDRYGVRLTEQAESLLVEAFGAATPCEPEKRPRSDRHKLKGRLSVRTTKALEKRFRKAIQARGYRSTQEALTAIVIAWLEQEERKNEEHI